MIFDLRQGLARELNEVRVGPVLDFVLEECGVSFPIFDLPIDIVAVEGGAALGLQRGDHRIIIAATIATTVTAPAAGAGEVEQRQRSAAHDQSPLMRRKKGPTASVVNPSNRATLTSRKGDRDGESQLLR
jgi:hypothetical protein